MNAMSLTMGYAAPVCDAGNPARAQYRHLLRVAAELTGLRVAELVGKSRETYVVPVRYAIMLTLQEAGRGCTQIAHLFDRDHTTIIYGVRKARKLRHDDPDYAQLCYALESA